MTFKNEHELSQKQSSKATLVLFCKRPKLNQGKQRLAQGSSAESALEIAKALLACAIEDANNWDGPVVIACSHNDDVEWAKSLIANVQVIKQLPQGKEGNLGERLNYVDSQLRAKGHQKIVIIGTDSPILSDAHYRGALIALNKNDIVLSHADDGGVIIMANKTPWPELIDLPWSTSELSHALSLKCQQSHLHVEYSLSGYDVDHVSDLKKLLIDLETDTRPARIHLLNTINQIIPSFKVNI